MTEGDINAAGWAYESQGRDRENAVRWKRYRSIKCDQLLKFERWTDASGARLPDSYFVDATEFETLTEAVARLGSSHQG